MADIAIFRVNYKSDFIITLESDAGWSTPFCIKFWTDSPQRAFYVQYDGETYTHCAPVAGEPTKLMVQMDDHHLGIGDLKYQIAYHFTVADFPHDTEDEVLNQAAVIINEDGQQEQVMLDLNGETAPEIAFSLPAYANEAQRIANEQQRIANEQQRIANEEQRITAEQQRITNENQRISNEEARVAEFARLKRESEAATEDANDAAVLATTAADLASAKAQLALDAATLANQKAQLAADKAALADSAATLATQKAQLAQEKATYAQTQGDYAKAQGNYAKAEGDAVKALNTQMTANEQTRQQNEQARQQAEQQRVTEFEQQMASQQTAYEQAEANRESAFETAEERRDAEVDEKVADITQLRTDLDNFEQEVDDEYAKKDGFYETMGVGTAVNLAGQQDRSNADKFRTSGGTEDIATGTARIEGIKGNAVAWNQLLNNGNFNSLSGWTVRYSGNQHIENGVLVATAQCQLRQTKLTYNHVYYACTRAKKTNEDIDQTLLIRVVSSSWSAVRVLISQSLTTDYVISSRVFTHTSENTNMIALSSPNTASPEYPIYVDYILLFDLTTIYGEGHEPSTPEQFEADYKRWFGKAIGNDDYDAGSLKPVLMTGYKTVGFNLLDPTTGKAHLVGTYGNTNVAQGLYCYEITGNYTSITDEDGNAITPVNGFFMVENPQEITVTGADENTCIHLTWSGWRNGESEAYWSDLSPIPVTTITGKLNGEGESVTMFADGMKKVGNTYDELKIENSLSKAIKRIGSRAYQEGDVSSDTMLTDGSTTTYYILATPQEYILDNFELPVRFKVDDFGTEEQIGQGIAAILTLKYGVNAVDVLRRLPQNYISVESMDKFLAQLGVAMNGTWSRTWNESNQEYDFTFVANSEPTPEPENANNQEEA